MPVGWRKTLQRGCYSFLSSKTGALIVFLLSVLSFNTLLHVIDNNLGTSLVCPKGTCTYDWADNIGGIQAEGVMCNEPIDVVYTWVNGSDPRHIAEVEYWQMMEHGGGGKDETNHHDATWTKTIGPELDDPEQVVGGSDQRSRTVSLSQPHRHVLLKQTAKAAQSSPTPEIVSSKDDTVEQQIGRSRFEDHDELLYSLRSLMANAPWVRRVFLVTNGQVPTWLNLQDEKIVVVPHSAIFPNKSHLPVFSSPAIEAHIHRIPGLSRRFLYFNDDTFFAAPVGPSDFYTPARGHRIFFSWPVPNCADGCPSNWMSDGYCDEKCNTTDCDWDGGDCIGDNVKMSQHSSFRRPGGGGSPYQPGGGGGGDIGRPGARDAHNENNCAPGCADSWIGDKYCDTTCDTMDCGFDATDCGIERYEGKVFPRLPILQASKYHQHFTLDHKATAVFLNLSHLIPPSSGRILEGLIDTPSWVRTSAISQKFKSLVMTVRKDADKFHPLVRVDIVGEVISKDAHGKEVKSSVHVRINVTRALNPNAGKVFGTREKSHTLTQTVVSIDETHNHKEIHDEGSTAPQARRHAREQAIMCDSGSAASDSHQQAPETPEPRLISGLDGLGEIPEDSVAMATLQKALQQHQMNERVDRKKQYDAARKLQSLESTHFDYESLPHAPAESEAERDHRNRREHGKPRNPQPIEVLSSAPLSAVEARRVANERNRILDKEWERQVDEVHQTVGWKQAFHESFLYPDTFRQSESVRTLSSIGWNGDFVEDPVDEDEMAETRRSVGGQRSLAKHQQEAKRQLLDMFGDSLKFGNKLLSKRFGGASRKVPSHMVHLIDKEVVEDLWSTWPNEFEVSSASKFRTKRNTQYAFLHMYYMIHAAKPWGDGSEFFSAMMDENKNGLIDEPEYRRIALLLWEKDVPLSDLKKALAEGTRKPNDEVTLTFTPSLDDGLEATPTQTVEPDLVGPEADSLEDRTVTASEEEDQTHSRHMKKGSNIKSAKGPSPAPPPHSPIVTGPPSYNIPRYRRPSPDEMLKVLTVEYLQTVELLIAKAARGEAEGTLPPAPASWSGKLDAHRFTGSHLERFLRKRYEADRKKYRSEIVPDEHDITFFMIKDNATVVQHNMDHVLYKRNKFLCINDNMNHSHPEYPKVVETIKTMLRRIFPNPSRFELPDGQRNPFTYLDQIDSGFHPEHYLHRSTTMKSLKRWASTIAPGTVWVENPTLIPGRLRGVAAYYPLYLSILCLLIVLIISRRWLLGLLFHRRRRRVLDSNSGATMTPAVHFY